MKSMLEWQCPLVWAKKIDKTAAIFAFLYSSKQYSYSGRYSYIACFPKTEIKSEKWAEFDLQYQQGISKDVGAKYLNSWFGYLGYELKNDLETLPEDNDGPISMPNLWMIQYHLVMVFDHGKNVCDVYYDEDRFYQQLLDIGNVEIDDLDINNIERNNLDIENKTMASLSNMFNSNMTDNVYKTKVSNILEAIKQGDLYQANLTRKYFAELSAEIDRFSLFETLSGISPSPYSAYLKYGDSIVLSTSPEQFLQIDNTGTVMSRPIKGTSPRYSDLKRDQDSFKYLEKSEKDRAENLMIVDLMRHDFSRSCVEGSVKVNDLFKVDSFSHIHHMASTVMGKKKEAVSTLDVVKQAFPPGSMTGAPKIKAMELCSQLEQLKRGVYSGAIGYFLGDGSCDLSVVIRTLIIQDNKFEFQVGGGIVYDSEPEKELKETFDKARGIFQTLKKYNIDK